MRMPLSSSTTAKLHLAPLLLGLPFQKRGQFIFEFGEHRTRVGGAFELSLEGRDIGTQVHVFGSLRRIAKFLGPLNLILGSLYERLRCGFVALALSLGCVKRLSRENQWQDRKSTRLNSSHV